MERVLNTIFSMLIPASDEEFTTMMSSSQFFFVIALSFMMFVSHSLLIRFRELGG